MDHGGKRKGAGRKPSPDKKQTVVLYIESSVINAIGGIKSTKQNLYNFAKIAAGGQKNKNNLQDVDLKNEQPFYLHGVSNPVNCAICGNELTDSDKEEGGNCCDLCYKSGGGTLQCQSRRENSRINSEVGNELTNMPPLVYNGTQV